MEKTQSKAGDCLIIEWKWWEGTRKAQQRMKSIIRITNVPDSVDKQIETEDLLTGEIYMFTHATVDVVALERYVYICAP